MEVGIHPEQEDTSRMNNKFVKMVLGFSMLIATACEEKQKTDQLVVKKSNAEIEVGMVRPKVEAILKSEGVEFSYVQSEAKIYAVRRSDSGFVKEATQFIISFDNQNRVASIEDKKLYTGP